MAIDKVKYWKELADYDIETAEVTTVEDGYMLALCAIWL